MKKIIILVLVSLVFLTGCEEKEKETKVDYSMYSFTDVRWSRDAEHDTETIRFNSDGTFGYSCGCGNPVNDSDMCDGYTYDDETKTIEFDCFDESDEMITSITIVEVTDDTLKLDFDGDIRVFTKE